MSGRPPLAVIGADGRELPAYASDLHAPARAAGVLIVVIEAVILATLVASYYYLRYATPGPWAGDGVDAPAAASATVTLGLMVASAAAMWIGTRRLPSADGSGQQRLVAGVGTATLLVVLAAGLRASDLAALEFSWRDHAYGSMVWLLLGFHLLHALVASFAGGTLTAMAMLRRVGPHQHAGVRALELYWYYVVLGYVPIYVTVFWASRLGA